MRHFSPRPHRPFRALLLYWPAIVLAVASPPTALAQPDCAEWDLRGVLTIVQSNGAEVALHLRQSGKRIEGSSIWTEVSRGRGEVYATPHYGGVSGTLDGGRFDAQVGWGNGSVGIYSGEVEASGRLRGTTYDRGHPNTKVTWHSKEAAKCLPPPQPPRERVARRIGKGTPAEPVAAPITMDQRVVPVASAPMPVGREAVRSASSGSDTGAVGASMGSVMGKQPDPTCKQGYVWREARPNDRVCVPPASRGLVRQENGIAHERWDPAGAYGSASCVSGYVWREAYQGDVVCVTPQRRTEVRRENALATSRRIAD